ncbi:hypothetical protein P5673_016458 [Acropora cervicornis]|uniref:Uncharacterized protein n=1 Tax=Acropora cervicornis TaxID=6130 RepID=A0AAD9QGX6_ACRCE|nr:hypothetical protein P5673_016458 [Acropora cervicornis]
MGYLAQVELEIMDDDASEESRDSREILNRRGTEVVLIFSRSANRGCSDSRCEQRSERDKVKLLRYSVPSLRKDS